ncbi:MAG: DNA-binding protein [Candidatus Aenigmatarchaeota archaeon]
MNMESQADEMHLEVAKKMMLSKILDNAAIERLGRVRMANPMLASQLELYLLQLMQAGQLKETITDAKLRQILDTLVTKRETKIIRR